MSEEIEYFIVNAKENYIYTSELSKYAELNQDLYLWVIEQTPLEQGYIDEDGHSVNVATKFVVEAEKLNRASLPPLNLILQSFYIGSWTNSSSNDTEKFTFINFNFPSVVENRKFTLKIGKVTDNTILTKIKNNDYTGITDLLSYAKSNKGVYTKELTTTRIAYYKSNDALFEGRSLLEHKAYYFIYVEFDDENGKYYPIEGVTLGQAYISSISDVWNLNAYTSSNFKWDNLTTTYTQKDSKTEEPTTTKETDDTTIKQQKLPQTGTDVVAIATIMIVISGIGIVFYRKYKSYKDIK